ncbi:MAG: hypothetical protein GY839_03940 [candidate division Zixibacteria bacterium]|nr:hypothetical protein [candidate division Zixibacteria bacterium]
MRSISNGRLCSIILILVFIAPAIYGQVGSNFNQRDDTYKLLGLKRSKETYETARAEYERQKELFDKKLISNAELDRAKDILSGAEVNYQQSLLAVLFEKQYVTITEAVKYHAKDGSRHVRLTLANASGGTAEFRKLLNIDDKLFRSLQPDIINNIYVSLLNDSETIISQPYESKIDQLQFGKPMQVDFRLLEDLDVVTVFLIYSNGSQRSMKIFLQKDATVNKVAVQSEQFSQEIELGKSATFDLSLELFSGVNKTYSLVVVNLPQQIGRFFKDPAGQARLSQVKFTESSRTKKADLEVSLPSRLMEDVIFDMPIPFFVVVLPREQLEDLPDMQSKQWTEDELDALGAGYVKLEMLPRGKGRLLVRAPQLYQSIKSDESADVSIELVNEGSRRLDNIEIKVDLPLNWSKTITPSIIPSLATGEETRVDLVFTPPDGIAVGKYDLRIRTDGMSDNQPANGEDKTLTIEIQASANIAGTTLVVLLIIVLVGGIVVFGIRLSRK